MPNKNYKRGFTAETRCKTDLINAGYWVERFYASKGTFDVIAVRAGCTTRLIQVKRSKRNVIRVGSFANAHSADIERMRLCPGLPTVSRELWVWIDSQYASTGRVGVVTRTQAAGWRKFVVCDSTIEELTDVI